MKLYLNKSKNIKCNSDDVMFLDYNKQSIIILDTKQFEEFLSCEDFDTIKAIQQCIIDHDNRNENTPIFVFNGLTAITISNFLSCPIQASRSLNSTVINDSIQLYERYHNFNSEVEVLNLHTGEIVKYMNLSTALEAFNHTLYHLLKLNIDLKETISIDEYCFPVIDEKWVYKPINHSSNWNTYLNTIMPLH